VSTVPNQRCVSQNTKVVHLHYIYNFAFGLVAKFGLDLNHTKLGKTQSWKFRVFENILLNNFVN